MANGSQIVGLAHETAIRAAVQASGVMMPFWPHPLNHLFDAQRALGVVTKAEGVGNFASVADVLSERSIIDTIKGVPQFRAHSISAEETGDIHGDGEWRWSIDPIDGTLNFLNGLPDFGICIALFHGDRVVVGVIAIPALRQLVAVRAGEAPRLLSYDGTELANLADWAGRMADRPDLSRTIVGYNLGYEHRDRQLAEIGRRIATKVGQTTSLGSFAVGNFRVVQGLMGAYFGMAPTVMDIAPAAALLTAAGGVVTDMSGNPIDWNAPRRTYLGSANRHIHEQLLNALSMATGGLQAS